MKLLIIVNSPYEIQQGALADFPQLNFQPLFNSSIYDVHKLMAGAKDNNGMAEAKLKEITGQPRNIPLGIDVVRELYKNTENVILIDGAFLQASEVLFITESLASVYYSVILSYNTNDDNVIALSYGEWKGTYSICKDDIDLSVINKIATGTFSTESVKNKSVPKETSNVEKIQKINKLLDEVDKEINDLSTPKIVDPLSLSLTDLLEYLQLEWNNDVELQTLPLRDVLRLLDINVTQIDKD